MRKCCHIKSLMSWNLEFSWVVLEDVGENVEFKTKILKLNIKINFSLWC